jgi:ParB family chromosome partitioning protein
MIYGRLQENFRRLQDDKTAHIRRLQDDFGRLQDFILDYVILIFLCVEKRMTKVELKGFKQLQSLDTLLDDSKKEIKKQHVCHLPIESLVPGKYQPRTHFHEDALAELAASIKTQGIIQPLIVRQCDATQYEIIAGERRFRAAQLIGLSFVPVIIRDINDETALAFALIENIQREDLNPIDEAQSLLRLKEEFAMTHDDIASRVGRSRSMVTNLMRLLSLQNPVKDLLKTKQLEMGHARALLVLDSALQLSTALEIVGKGLSVRQSERLVQKLKSQELGRLTDDNTTDVMEETWLAMLPKEWSGRVNVKINNQGKGKVVIQVASLDELESIVKKLF